MDKDIAVFLLQILGSRTITCGDPGFWETAEMVKRALDALNALAAEED